MIYPRDAVKSSMNPQKLRGNLPLTRIRNSGLLLFTFLLSVLLVVSGCSESTSIPRQGSGVLSGPPFQLPSSQQWTVSEEAGVALPSLAQVTLPNSLENNAVIDGVPVGLTEEGYPFLGDPTAPLALVEYSDYLCPFCALHQERTASILRNEYVATGKVVMVFRDLPLVALHPAAPQAHIAAGCVAQQDAALFWPMHDRLFAAQGQWNSAADPAEALAQLAVDIGADRNAYDACIASGVMARRIEERIANGEELGFNSTPTFHLLVNETGRGLTISGAQPETLFSDAIEALLSGRDVQDLSEVVADGAATPDVDLEAAAIVTLQESEEQYQGLPAGFTAEGYPYLGNPDAPISLVEFSDYLCPFCGRHFSQTWPDLLEQYGEEGKVNFVFRDMPLSALHPTAHYGHEAALCVGEQSAAQYWQMHDQLFTRQAEWSSLPDPTPFLRGIVEEIGASLDAYDRCMAEGGAAEIVAERVAQGNALGFNGTPSFHLIDHKKEVTYDLVGAQTFDYFATRFDAVAAGEALPEDEVEEAELPFWASPEGLAPDPERDGYTIAGDPYKGNPEAEVVVVEFADFQCEPCQQHALEVQPALDAALVDSGEIMWVFKSLPLKEHAQALDAAVAAECAGDQGRFWPMHDLLFEQLETWSDEAYSADFIPLVESLGMDVESFTLCMNGRDALEAVVYDMYDAQGTAQRTPTFAVLKDGKGSVLNGSQPAENFVKILRTFIDGEGLAE